MELDKNQLLSGPVCVVDQLCVVWAESAQICGIGYVKTNAFSCDLHLPEKYHSPPSYSMYSGARSEKEGQTW